MVLAENVDLLFHQGVVFHKSGLTLKKKKQLYGPFLWMEFNCLKATATSRRQFTFYHSVPRNSWYSFYRPRKDEGLSRPLSRPWVSFIKLDIQNQYPTTTPVSHVSDEERDTRIQAWKLCVIAEFLKLNVGGECRKISTLTRIVYFVVASHLVFCNSYCKA